MLCSNAPLLDGIAVDFSGGLVADANQHLPLRSTDSGHNAVDHGLVLQLCGAGSGHHDMRFAATKERVTAEGRSKSSVDEGADADAEHIIVSCQLRSGEPKSAAQLRKQCYIVCGESQREVDLLLSISPHEPNRNHPADDVLGRRCVHISSDAFCYHESALLYDPKQVPHA